MNTYKTTLLSFFLFFFLNSFTQGLKENGEYAVSSPDKNIIVTCNPQKALYRISYKGQPLLMDSKLGVVREDEDFSKGLKVVRVSNPVLVKDSYSMLTTKKKNIIYTATETVIETSTGLGRKMNIIFRVSNDGVAFRYEFPESSVDIKRIKSEETSFHFQPGTKAWLQPKAEAQTGFEHSNPSYEAHYMMDIETGTPSPTKNGWVYPALFRHKDVWMLITEAALGRTYCGTALQQNSPDREYKIGFPQAPEVFSKGTLNPESTLPWRTPWRIIVLGDMKTIAESTLGTDLALPAVKMETSFIDPGKSSWSWILKKDDSTVFSVQKNYVDFAADMKWQYCLLDATWDVLMGYDSVRLLAEYARKKNVGLLLWYNSAGDWNTVKFTPRDKLLTHESRMKEFARLREMGIRGLKIDFFSGDGQSMINYYQDILDDAAANHLLVNFHGATLPRGLHRTYPNLMTMEAVFGYEMITFGQESANKAPAHSVMSALVRNAFDPMDFTPMNLYKIPNIKRVTTPAFELATSVIFLSGIQHYAESPEGMTHVPEQVKNFLRQLPNSWDDVKFIDGYPGKLYVVARKSGNKWYVAGINGEGTGKSLQLDLSFLKNNKGQLIASGTGTSDEPSFNSTTFIVPASGKATIDLKGNDGFVIVFEQFPYQNAQLSSEERAKDLISRLTLPEKAALMCDVSDAIPSLGIKKFNWWSEALHGLANNNDVTVFPEPIGMAASFNDELVYKIFNATSDEVRARYHESLRKGNENRRFLSLSVWTPNVNIFRDPRWGRGQETYGEDPYLTSRMGVSVVKGLQGPADAKYKKLLACAKHYAVHSGPEWSRHELNLNNVDPRDLWETYLPAFKALVQDADVRQVMCAYQRLDDEPCCSNTRLLQNILREQWGFKYLVVSDCGAIGDFYTSHKVSSDATHAAAKGVLAGTDVECQWDNHNYKLLPQAVEKGLISEHEIDRRLMRVLIGRFDLGEMDNDELVPWTKIPASVINNEAHRKLALDMSLESMTLLQNNDILPLKKSVKKIAVIGPNANDKPMLWGNYNGTPVRTITILDGITSKLPANKILYDKGCDLVENKVTESYFSNCSIDGKKGFKATYWNSRDRSGGVIATQEITNPIKLTTAGQHEFASGVKLEGFSALYITEFTAPEDEEIVFKTGATGSFELLVNGKSIQRYNNWRTLPSRVPFKVEKGKKYTIEIRFAQLNNWAANLEFNFGKEVDVDYTELLNKLKGIDVVVFAGGLSTLLEGEEMPVSYPGFKGGDRTDIELPEVQRNCLKALKAAGKKVIFVNCSGSSIGLVPETKSCDAILQAWYGGESGGQAVADVLFGDYNPSGKLPITFYKDSSQLAGFEDYSMKGRTYRYMSDPLFPFGFGLSYTSFTIGKAQILKAKMQVGETVELKIPVLNTGKRNGTEVVQVYIRKAGDINGPIKTLKEFQRITVEAGKSSMVSISLPPTAFEFFDRKSGRMTIASGEYELLYGNSSADKDLKSEKIYFE